MIIDFNEASELKSLGFTGSTAWRYHSKELELDYGNWNSWGIEHVVAAPTCEEVFAWFRNKFNLLIVPTPKVQFPDNQITNEFHLLIYKDGIDMDYMCGTYWGYEKASLEGIKMGIKILQELKEKDV